MSLFACIKGRASLFWFSKRNLFVRGIILYFYRVMGAWLLSSRYPAVFSLKKINSYNLSFDRTKLYYPPKTRQPRRVNANLELMDETNLKVFKSDEFCFVFSTFSCKINVDFCSYCITNSLAFVSIFLTVGHKALMIVRSIDHFSLVRLICDLTLAGWHCNWKQ